MGLQGFLPCLRLLCLSGRSGSVRLLPCCPDQRTPVLGHSCQLKVDALPGKIFNGEVTAISEATGSKYSLVPTDNSAGNFVKVQQRIPVRIELENISSEEMAQLRAGMMVETEALRK